MGKLSKYRWTALIVLAVFCQLILSRVPETSPTQSLSTADLTKVDQAVLVAAPQNPFASAEGKAPEYLKANGSTLSKFIGSWADQQHVAESGARQSLWRSEFQGRSSERLWLLYRTLLL